MNLRHIDPRSTEWMETIEAMADRGANPDKVAEGGMELSANDVHAGHAPGQSKTSGSEGSSGRFENRVHALGSPPR